MTTQLKLDSFDPNRIKWYYAIHLHFTNKEYDCIASKYNVRNLKSRACYNANVQTLEHISKKFVDDSNYKMFLTICFLHGAKNIHDIKDNFRYFNGKYVEHRQIYDNLVERYEYDIKLLRKTHGSLSNCMKSDTGQLPHIISMVLTRDITWETLVILDNVFGKLIKKNDEYRLTNYIDKRYNTLMWKKYRNIMIKYSAFFSCKNDEFYQMINHKTTNIFDNKEGQ